MEVNNPLYKNQGIHVVTSIFTIEKGIAKVLLIRRRTSPYQDKWALVGGALYNNEDLVTGLKREIYEKSGIKNIECSLCGVFGEVKRSPIMRMVAVSYIGVIDCDRVEILKETSHTSNADWFPIDSIPELAYDHNEILVESLTKLQTLILQTNMLKSLFPNGFTIPEIQKTYEAILNRKFDRRNFRRSLLGLGLVFDTNREVKFEGKKLAKLYQFKDTIENKNVF